MHYSLSLTIEETQELIDWSNPCGQRRQRSFWIAWSAMWKVTQMITLDYELLRVAAFLSCWTLASKSTPKGYGPEIDSM